MQKKPVHILTGFLGSGKTTLLNRLLKLHAFSRTLVIVNEFGEISLDHHLFETSQETIFELSNGCLCCSMRGELVETLLAVDSSRFDRIIMETTGIADPLPVFQTLCLEEIRQRELKPGAIITVLDAQHGEDCLKSHHEARRQLALADLVFVSHSSGTDDTDAARLLTRRYNTHAAITDQSGGLHPDAIKPTEKLDGSAHGTTHPSSYRSVLLENHDPVPISVWMAFLQHLAAAFGNGILRVKGIALASDHEQPVILQMSGTMVHEPQTLADWPAGERITRLVAITQNLDPALIHDAFGSFLNIPGPDRPDRQALTGNPLSIPGA